MGPKDLSENMAPPHGLSDCPSYILMPQFEEFEGVPFKQTHVDHFSEILEFRIIKQYWTPFHLILPHETASSYR